MSAPDWNELRSDGRVVVDAPARKLAVYANLSGSVVLLSVEDGKGTYTVVEAGEMPDLMQALARAYAEAHRIDAAMQAEYQSHLAIERAREMPDGR